jgi:hypothetical protein
MNEHSKLRIVPPLHAAHAVGIGLGGHGRGRLNAEERGGQSGGCAAEFQSITARKARV